jgi:hypothetical protein
MGRLLTDGLQEVEEKVRGKSIPILPFKHSVPALALKESALDRLDKRLDGRQVDHVVLEGLALGVIVEAVLLQVNAEEEPSGQHVVPRRRGGAHERRTFEGALEARQELVELRAFISEHRVHGACAVVVRGHIARDVRRFDNGVEV